MSQASSPCVGSWRENWVELSLILFGTIDAQMLQVTLSSCENFQPSPGVLFCDTMVNKAPKDMVPVGISVRPFDWQSHGTGRQLMSTRHGCRPDEAAKDPQFFFHE